MKVYKYHANGNSFLLFYQLKKQLDWKKLCDIHEGMGADGVLLLYKKKGYYELKIINADGSIANMCGNGLRIAGLFLREQCKNFSFYETIRVGDLWTHVFSMDNEIAVEVPYPSFCKTIGEWNLYDIGNLHLIKKVDVLSEKYLIAFAQNHLNYNCTVYQIVREGQLKILTYERGVGITLSCGSASLATFLDYKKDAPWVDEVVFLSRGGVYVVKEHQDHLFLIGTPKKVWKGEWVDNERD